MTPKEEPRRGLGRGLSALIGDENIPARAETPKATRSLPVAFLKPGKFQPRKYFGEEELASLAASIKEKGILTPILVRPLGTDSYEIVAGERRWRAAQMAKLHDVPVVVRELQEKEIAWKSNGTHHYQELAKRSLATMHECDPLPAPEAGRPQAKPIVAIPLHKIKAAG